MIQPAQSPSGSSYRRQEVEARYRRMRGVAKPVDYQGRDFQAFDLRPFLDEVLPQLATPAEEPWAFEYGTGTGPGAHYLAERGFQVDAIDTSPTAIDLARRFAAEKGLRIGFHVADIARLPSPGRTYDLVVDNFCLHNLITRRERRRALANVLKLLGPRGHFLLGTSVFDPGREYGVDVRDELTGIVYRPLPPGPREFTDARLIGGEWFYARARHVRPSELCGELEAAGFRVVCQRDGGRFVWAQDARESGGWAADEPRQRDPAL